MVEDYRGLAISVFAVLLGLRSPLGTAYACACRWYSYRATKRGLLNWSHPLLSYIPPLLLQVVQITNFISPSPALLASTSLCSGCRCLPLQGDVSIVVTVDVW